MSATPPPAVNGAGASSPPPSDSDQYGYSGDSDFEDDPAADPSSSSSSSSAIPPTGLAEDSVGSFSDDSRYGIVINGALSATESVAAAALEGTGGVDLNTELGPTPHVAVAADPHAATGTPSPPTTNNKTPGAASFDQYLADDGNRNRDQAAPVDPIQTSTPTPSQIDASATRIQQLARARSSRRRVADLRSQRAAAIHIQRVSRARTARTLTRRRRKEKKSAVLIQSANRSRVARRVVAEKRSIRYQQQTNAAAVKLQSQHRRRAASLQVESLRSQRALETQSAVRLQSLTRGGLQRRRARRRRELEAHSATAVQKALRGKMARQRVALKRKKIELQRLKKDRKQRKKWSGLNKQIKSPYNELLTYKGITGRNGGGGIGLDAAGVARSRRLKRRADDGSTAVLIGGPSLLGGGSSSSSLMQTPLISLDPVVDAEADAYAAREVDGMVDEANSEIMMLARSSLESVMLAGEPSTTMIRKEDDPGANDGPSGTEVERSRIPETLSPVPSENHDFLGVTGGGSALLNLDESIPSLESMALAANSTRLGKNRVSEMRKSIDFIKERFSALKQIAQLDPATAAEGGWTEDAVEEELNKLKAELARERETLREALYAASPSLERGGAAGRGKWGGGSGMSTGLSSYNPNLSTSSSMSAARERLFSESVAKKLVKLTKRLDRTCKLHAIEVRRRRDGDPLRMRERFSPLVSHKLHPSPVFHLKPLFRGDKSPEGIHRQRRRARASITTRGNRRSRK